MANLREVLHGKLFSFEEKPLLKRNHGDYVVHKFNVKMEAELTRDELSSLFEKYGERLGAVWDITPIGEEVPTPIEVPKSVEE